MHTWEYLESSANYPKMVFDRYIMNLEQHCILFSNWNEKHAKFIGDISRREIVGMKRMKEC